MRKDEEGEAMGYPRRGWHGPFFWSLFAAIIGADGSSRPRHPKEMRADSMTLSEVCPFLDCRQFHTKLAADMFEAYV